MTTTLARRPTQSTLPPAAGFLSRSGSGDESNRQPQLPTVPTLPSLENRPDGPVRSGTQTSSHSGVSELSQDDRPLLRAAAPMSNTPHPFAGYTADGGTATTQIRRNDSTFSPVSPMSQIAPPWAMQSRGPASLHRKPLPTPFANRTGDPQTPGPRAPRNMPPRTPTYGARRPTQRLPGPSMPMRSMTAGPQSSGSHNQGVTRNFSFVQRPATAGPMTSTFRAIPESDTRGPAYELQAPLHRPSTTQTAGPKPVPAYQPESYTPFIVSAKATSRPPRSPPYDGRIIDAYR